MAIWEWALEAYGRPGVPQASLVLQDDHGQNTSLLLWAVYAEVQDPALLKAAAEAARTWDGLAIRPLRDVRRALKAPCPPIPDGARARLRADVNEAELRAERMLLELLEHMAGRASGGAHALAALKGASAAWGTPAPDEALAVLAQALG